MIIQQLLSDILSDQDAMVIQCKFQQKYYKYYQGTRWEYSIIQILDPEITSW